MVKPLNSPKIQASKHAASWSTYPTFRCLLKKRGRMQDFQFSRHPIPGTESVATRAFRSAVVLRAACWSPRVDHFSYPTRTRSRWCLP